MSELEIDAVVFDVLGTLVDEPAGIRAGIRELDPSLGDPRSRATASAVAAAHRTRAAVASSTAAGPTSPATASTGKPPGSSPMPPESTTPAAVAALALSGRRLPPWPDTVAGLARLAERFPLIGLSNASRTALLGLNAHAGLRWHQALSAEDARTYKPDPAVYQLAVTVSGRPPERLLMVAAHAWDLRGAQDLGLRTAYVARPVGDPPTTSDRFDLHADGLADLADQLGKETGATSGRA